MADNNETMMTEETLTPFGENILAESYEMTPEKETPAWVKFVEGVLTGVGVTLGAGTATWFLTKKGRQEKREKEIDKRVEEKLIELGIIKEESED